MKAVLDTCVLYPTVMREILLGVAASGAFEPLWSARILEEWARAARKLGPEGEVQARGEIALVRAGWPEAEVMVPGGLADRLWLPDEDDVHVLAAAVTASADVIVTLNAKDFPRGTLAEEGLERVDPDQLLMQCLARNDLAVRQVGERVLSQARQISGAPWEMRALLRKARLPRLAKALG